MPYIDKEGREIFAATLAELEWPANAGDLNYVITHIVQNYIRVRGLRYEHINAAIGALECAKLELYRRLASPYEDSKIKENGDVYVIPKGLGPTP